MELPALHKAADSGDLEEVKRVLASGAIIDEPGPAYNRSRTALGFAVLNNHTDVVKYLIDKGANIHVVDDEQDSALSLAASRGHADLVQYLLDHGALSDLESRDKDGYTPLTTVIDSELCSSHRLDVVKCLVEHGADVNNPGFLGKTPLWYALCERGEEPEIAQYLREHGAIEPYMPCGPGCEKFCLFSYLLCCTKM